MKNLCVLWICITGLFCGAGLFCGVRAQSAAASSKNVYAPVPDSILKEQARLRAEEQAREEAKMKLYKRFSLTMPDTVLNLLYGGEFDRAYTVLMEFLQAQPADIDPYHLVLLEEEYYARRRFVDSANFDFYTKKRTEFVDRLLKEFPQHVESYILLLDENTSSEDELRVFNRMIEVDSTYLPAYEQRGLYWFQHNQLDKFCEDFRRLPTQIANLHPEFWECK